ncbi:MAG: hypothetical protein JXR77_01385 [Lentisphaeria bacterium]|nr:hypothetical protein [Lentisphaeria bacterium]
MPEPDPAAAADTAMATPAAAADKAIRGWQWLVICMAVYLVRILPWATAELWHDEVITLTDFAVGPRSSGLAHVFRFYPVANNHMLFSAVAWWWVRVTGFSSQEYLLRLPSILFGALSVVLIARLWAGSLGSRLARLAALAAAISPVCTAFAYQFRGYSLTMLLSVLVAAGAAEIAEGRVRRGLWLQGPAFLLLPLVIPSNVTLAFAHGLFLVLWPGAGLPRRRRLTLAAASVAPALLGASYYLTLWPQFVAVIRQTSGWPSEVLVLGNVALGIAAHLGVFAVVLVAAGVSRVCSGAVRRGETADRGSWALLYAVCLAVPVLATVLASSGTAPFPRVFLVYLFPFSLAAFRALRHSPRLQAQPLLVLGGLVLAAGFLIERAGATLAEAAMRRGRHPQNLLQQYYRGSDDLRVLAAAIAAEAGLGRPVVITNAYDFPTFRFYWAQQDRPAEAVTADNRQPAALWQQVRRMPGATLVAVARDETEAAGLFHAAGQSGHFDVVARSQARKAYLLLPERPAAGPRPP